MHKLSERTIEAMRNLCPGEERAVSPVIGVILMVAITVVLAAVIGAFVLGFGSQASSTAPQATFTFDEEPIGDLTITHEGGTALDADRLTVKVDGTAVSGVFSGEVTSGDSGTVAASELSSGDEVRVVYEGSGGQTYTVASHDYQG